MKDTLYSKIQADIKSYEEKLPHARDFYRNYTKSLMDRLVLDYIDEQGGLSTAPIIFANPERAIAKIKEDRNLKLPLVSLGIGDIEENTAVRKPDVQITHYKFFDVETQRASRVIKTASKAVQMQFQITLWAKYTEDMNQLMESLQMLFLPALTVPTENENASKAYLMDILDMSSLQVGDKQDRILRKRATIKIEGYIPGRQYLYSNTGRIKELINTEISIEGVDDTPVGGDANKVEYYLDQKTVLSDGYTMLYNIYLPTTRNEFEGKLPLVVITPSTGGWRHSAPPSSQFLDDTTNPDPSNIMEILLSEGYAVMKYDVRGQATPWSSQGGGGTDNSFFQPENIQYSVSAEFGAENFAIRELLDLFEIRDNVVGTYASAIDETRVATMGGSLGGLAASMGAAWSGKTVPYNSIVSSQDEFLEAGAIDIPDLSGTWGYSPSDKFSTFKAVAIASFTGDLESLTAPDGVRSPYLSGPLRTYDINFYAPREVAKFDGPLREDRITDYSDTFPIRNDFMGEIATTTVPSLFQFSYDDRQRSIDIHRGVYDLITSPKHFFVSTGHHHSPENYQATELRNDNIKRWFNQYVKDIPDAFGIDSQYVVMETPGDVDTYRDPNDKRKYRFLDTLEPPQIEIQPYVLSRVSGNNILVNKEVSEVAGSTVGKVTIEHTMLPDGPNSTNAFIEEIIDNRKTPLVASDIIGKWFTEDTELFVMDTPFEKDMLMLGPASGSFTVSSDASGQFYYDIMEYDENLPDGEWNPRVVAGGNKSWHTDGIVSSIDVPSRFQCYKFEEGKYLAIRLKNHTYFAPPIKNPAKSVFEVMPFSTDYTVSFDFTGAGCFVNIPMIDYSLLP